MKLVFVDKSGWLPYYTIPEDNDLAIEILMRQTAEAYFDKKEEDASYITKIVDSTRDS